MKIFSLFILILLFIFELQARIITIPTEYTSIQVGIDNSADGDTVLIKPGTYYEQLVIDEKSITLSSNYIFSKDPAVIGNTIIDGNNSAYVLSIPNSAGTEILIHGLTIQNGDDGIFPYVPFTISNCIIRNCTDGIDYEKGSGGICQDNTFENNEDDGIDLDGAVDIVIENNKIINNTDDGIEIRLQSYVGPTLNIIIKNNIISGNEEDGIQFIDYPGLSDRVFTIENNLIVDNLMVGVGCIDYGPTDNYEYYEGTSLPEPIFLINNTISGNNHGVTGGANLIAFNNIIVNCIATAMKNVNGNSLISYSNFWNNGQNFDNCIRDDQSLVLSDPLFASGSDYHLQDSSPCLGKGVNAGAPARDIEYIQRGNPPDIGAYENITTEDQTLPVDLKSFNGNFLNGNIELNWTTTGELNNLGYEIYVKEDQNEFRYLAGYSKDNSLLGLGNSSQGKQYTYSHQNVIRQISYLYKLIQFDFSGEYTEYEPIEISTIYDPTTDNPPGSIFLQQNFPNPFNPSTIINYELRNTSFVDINIFNSLGQKIVTLVSQLQNSGSHHVEWNAGHLSSGIYFYVLRADEFLAMEKMVLLK